MSSLLNRVLGQFDTLIPFLSLTHEEVFNILHQRYAEWLPEWEQGSLPETFAIYQTQVTHSAFLLGYSYYEAFLPDLVREIYRVKPEMLSPGKTMMFSEILDSSDYDSILIAMIDKEVRSIFGGYKKEVIDIFEKQLQLHWPEKAGQRMVVFCALTLLPR